MGVLLDLAPSETGLILRDLCISGMSLQADPAAAGVVCVWAEDAGHEEYAIGKLSPAEPAVAVPRVVVRGGFVLRHDSVAATVRFYGRVLGPPPPAVSGGEEEEEEEAVLDDDGGEEEEVADEAAAVEYEPLTEEDMAERYDSDNGEDHGGGDGDAEGGEPRKGGDGGEAAGESSSKRSSVPLVAAPAGSVVPDGDFLGPARFAAVENTSGFMRLAAAVEAASGNQEGKEIVVLYRYTRFSRTWSGRRGVEACRRTKLHRLRFAVPPAGDMASSLAWAGASLSPVIYPGLFRRQLEDLWSSLAAPAIDAIIPPRAARLQVVVDVGILRREDHTAERMEHMHGALEEKMQEAWPKYYHVGMELRLPEPVRCDEEHGEDTRPAKRRKVADEEAEECSVCLETLESGLAAWPGCGHVFHGVCVEKTLARSEMCPLCRNKLSDQPVC